MKLLKYKHGIVTFFCLATTGAFSLFGMRYVASREALQVKRSEQELQKLQTLAKRMDIRLAYWQHQQRALYAKRQAQRVLWIKTDNHPSVKTSLAYNH